MNKRDLIQKTADKTGFTKKECEAVLNALFETITETIESGEKVQIIGFGTFESRERAARTARNPRTGEMVTVPARRMPAFKPGADLKQAVVQA
ncbi:DNA-binding protein HU-beta [Alicyclobacillus hesperidum]|uniref:DNA-binding protein HU-beta n=1 Tax=Alicyclobacillus hesperidum TaxID=89784 RepID=A0A1H2YA88_9BACL|nr:MULTISPECIES: HU family DNA-binding protein [Alicyclobacillus]SDX02142.1 DNA-binding protein HU-beta [Alicyclobacillus hesperidum]